MIKTIYFAGKNDSVIIPSKRKEDAGYDIYANFKGDFMMIKPHTTNLIPTGLYSAFNPKWYIQLEERGSTGTKGIAQRCGVIDSGFRGSIKVRMINHDPNYAYSFERGDKIVQMVVQPVLLCGLEEVKELDPSKSGRDDSGFGSTGK